MSTAAAIGITATLLALGLFQAALASGRPLGRFAWGGTHVVLPNGLRIASAVSILLYAAMAVVALDAAGPIDVVPGDWTGTAVWVLAGYFLIGVGMNALSRSRSERHVMTPVAAALCLLCIVVATGG